MRKRILFDVYEEGDTPCPYLKPLIKELTNIPVRGARRKG